MTRSSYYGTSKHQRGITRDPRRTLFTSDAPVYKLSIQIGVKLLFLLLKVPLFQFIVKDRLKQASALQIYIHKKFMGSKNVNSP